ncbi:hypothetical protein JAAARDRAFT_416399 [Jaapia argillacea MUCL 33604]|uniref:Uncharacterized protein n=1 Tax=Jaapia argillacea MUCL 33604 TaxID=933084 RepID=A0A067PGI5_9AGAM|nr:hypothetical protein JAAARDRAFT_416399 [Jaapia argillacea MUCL 33604]
MQRTSLQDKRQVAAQTQEIESLKKETEASKKELVEAELKFQDQIQKWKDEKETALAVERSLREHYSRMNTEWSGKYEVALAECRRLHEEVKRLRRSLGEYVPQAPQPPRALDHYFQLPDGNFITSADPLIAIDEEPAQELYQEPMFKLSPLPSTIATPIELPDSVDKEPARTERESPYLLRSIQPISIKAPEPRFSSMLTRQLQDSATDMEISRSLPSNEGGIHALMSSRGPSPPRPATTVNRIRQANRDLEGDVVMLSSSAPRQSLLNEQRPMPPPAPAPRDSRDPDEQRQQWRNQLWELLDNPVPSSSSTDLITLDSASTRHASGSRESGSRSRSASPTSSGSQTRQSNIPVPVRRNTEPTDTRPTITRPETDRSYSDNYTTTVPPFQLSVSPPRSPSPSTAQSRQQQLSGLAPYGSSLAPPFPPPPRGISRASSAAREAEKQRAAATERLRKEAGSSSSGPPLSNPSLRERVRSGDAPSQAMSFDQSQGRTYTDSPSRHNSLRRNDLPPQPQQGTLSLDSSQGRSYTDSPSRYNSLRRSDLPPQFTQAPSNYDQPSSQGRNYSNSSSGGSYNTTVSRQGSISGGSKSRGTPLIAV